MKKIYPKDWLELHPYRLTDSVDLYYTGIANKIYGYLSTSAISDAFDDDKNLRYTSLCLAAWFEDVISQTGIWQAFTAECQRRYGSYLPFYPLNDNYYPDEINLEDVRFLLWHHTQYFRAKDTIVNPENPGIELAAYNIYNILADEYETAPENERMQHFLLHSDMGKEDFLLYRTVLEWFHYSCYFNIENMDQFMDESDCMLNSEEITEEKKDIMNYGIQTTLMLQGRRSPLSLTSPEWLARITQGIPERRLWKDVEVRKSSCFLLTGEDDDFLYLKDLCKRDDKTLNILKKSLNMAAVRNRIIAESILICELVHYGDCWWQCGLLLENKMDEKLQSYIDEQTKKDGKPDERAAFKDFMKASGGRFFIFCRNKEEIIDFFTNKMGYQSMEGVELPPINVSSGAILMAGPQSGLHIQYKLCECIKSPDNPFYNQEKAEEEAISFIANPNVIPYELSCILQDKEMLPDASLKSLKGKKHAKEFIHKNAQFLTDYFHHQCRDKDFEEKE